MALNTSYSTPPNRGQVIKRADPSTIQNKFLVGYQGWFTCPGDGEPVDPGHHGWLHWFTHPPEQGGRPNTDVWPDVSEYDESELYPVPGYKTKAGDQVHLFSSRHPNTVQRHFHWMAKHGVDGAFLQRFVGQCDLEAGNHGILKIRDEVGDRVREAAEKEGRVWAIMYDVSGVASERLQQVIIRDWMHLLRDKGILNSPNYLREKGKPVLALWGFGFDGANHNPNVIATILSQLRSFTPGGLYLFAGVPGHWRTSSNDADSNPEFLSRVWLKEFDAISPWTVGRYKNEDEANDWAEKKIKADIELIKKHNEEVGDGGRKIDYVPVVLPGGSGYNLSKGKWAWNDMKRNGGRFLWQQIYNARRQGVRIIYGAMWDEYDEGTAFMPVVETKSKLPVSDTYQFMALDEDKFDVPSDWYMRICGFAGELLRGERELSEVLPSKDLHDYWSRRPKYEYIPVDQIYGAGGGASGTSNYPGSSSNYSVPTVASSSPYGSGTPGAGESPSTTKDTSGAEGGQNQSYQEWLAQQQHQNPSDKDEPPPPPYSLEAEDHGPQPASSHEPVATPTPAPAPAPAPTNQSLPQQVPTPASGPSGPSSPAPSGPGGCGSGPAAYGGPSHFNPNIGAPQGPAHAYGYSPASPRYPVAGPQGPGPDPPIPIPTLPNFGAPHQGYGPPSGYGPGPAPPHAHAHGQPYPPAQSPYGPVDPAIASLTSEFEKQKLSERPPLHPSHPAANSQHGLGRVTSLSGGRPTAVSSPPPTAPSAYPGQGYPGSGPGPGQSPSHSQPHSPVPGPSQPLSPSAGPPQQPSGYWSQAQWPPADWQAPSGAPGGANLNRPHTYTASGASAHHGGANLRPHASLSGKPTGHPSPGGSIFPNYGGPASSSSPPPPVPGSGPGAPSFHILGGGSQFPTYPPTNLPPGGPSGPGGYPPYHQPQHHHHQYPGGGSYGPPHGPGGLYPSPNGSNPTSPHLSPQPSGPSGPNPNTSPIIGGTPHGIKPPVLSASPPPGPAGPGSSYYNPDPYGKLPPGPSGYYDQQTPVGPSGYPSGLAAGPSGSSGYGGAYPPAGPSGHGPGPSFLGGPVPGLPPRPPTHSALTSPGAGPSAPPGGISFPVATGATGNALNYAFNTIEGIAGKKTRTQLENGVGNLAQSGTKLWNKFSK
ncbi:hypothetical protein AX16_009359 [Volvariella volvacea WC 439]|nr:hypothetical protein AX16_009359 [Volvariella volvacea WC 439]